MCNNHGFYGLRTNDYQTDYYNYLRGDVQMEHVNTTVTNEIFGVAVDLDNGRMWISKGHILGW